MTDRSFCVMPCWIRSPITISSMRSNGWSELSSRRPMSLVSTKTKQKATTARTTMSIYGKTVTVLSAVARSVVSS